MSLFFLFVVYRTFCLLVFVFLSASRCLVFMFQYPFISLRMSLFFTAAYVCLLDLPDFIILISSSCRFIHVLIYVLVLHFNNTVCISVCFCVSQILFLPVRLSEFYLHNAASCLSRLNFLILLPSPYLLLSVFPHPASPPSCVFESQPSPSLLHTKLHTKKSQTR